MFQLLQSLRVPGATAVIIALSFGLSGSLVFSAAVLEGEVLDSTTGAAVEGARVEVDGTGHVAYSDHRGYFKLERALEPGDQLVVHADGYSSRRIVDVTDLVHDGVPFRITVDPVPMHFREQVIVTATRTRTPVSEVPGSVSILEKSELSATPSPDLFDALDSVAGIHKYSAWGNPMDIGLETRGFSAGGYSSYLVVLVDGQPVNDPDTGIVDWNMLPLDSIEKVEIQRGPASALYGDIGMGGVVHLFTRPSTDLVSSSLSFDAGSFGEKRARFGHTGKSRRIAYDMSASLSESDGYREGSSWSSNSLRSSATIALGDRSNLLLSTLNSWLDNDSPGPLTADQISNDPTLASTPFDNWNQNRNSLSAGFRHEYSSGSKLSLDLTHRILDSNKVLTIPMELQFGDALMPMYDVKRQENEADTTMIQGQVEGSVEWHGLEHRLITGLEFSTGNLDSTYRPVDEEGNLGDLLAGGSGSRKTAAVYVQDQLQPMDSLRFIFGLRYDRFDDSFREEIADDSEVGSEHDALSPKIGMIWEYHQNGEMYLQLGKSFRAPTMEQLFDQRRPFDYELSNEKLEPQKANNYEIGVRHSFSRHFELETSFYWMKIKNEIEFDPATFQMGNIGESLHKGAELSLKSQLMTGVSAFFNYALQDATYQETAGDDNQIRRVPRHLGSLGIRYRTRAGWSSSMVLRTVGRQFLDDENFLALDSYSTLDAKVGYSWSNIELYAAGLNILDEEYATNGFINPRTVLVPGPVLDPTILLYPSPGRSYRVGLRWILNSRE